MASENAAGKETGADGSGSKKGRFMVKFAVGRRDSEGAEMTTPVTPHPPPIPSDDVNRVAEGDEDTNFIGRKQNLYLYEEDMKSMPRVVTFLQMVTMSGSHTTYPNELEEKAAKRQPTRAKLGIMLGVYLPTIQHILGLMMFIRHAWVVGCSGVLEGFAMVFMCCLTTFLTSISLSAIATNGMVQSGGSYYMLSRNLGPECGGSIGICFYLANTFATCLYLLGAIEILLLYIAPELAIFGDIHDDPWNNFRLYGTVIMFILTLIVAVGVKFVQMFAPISLACVIISFLSIIIGACLATAESTNIWVCYLGDRLLESPKSWHASNTSTSTTDADWCNKDITGDIWSRYCTDENGTTVCDEYYVNNDVRLIAAIPGFASGVIANNLFSRYLGTGEVTPGVVGEKHHREVTSDMTTGFVALCAIYFPSVTGILTGANMSGDLRDPQKSIPAGTILAQLTCSFIFILLVFFYGGTTQADVLRDKFGTSVGGGLLSALLCWPSPWVVLIGALASSVGAALQCLTSAPRLLQAIARDDIIPFLSIFKKTNSKNEPIRAIILTFFIAEIGIIIANIESVAPLIDVFFLVCYLFVNLICVLQTLLKTPNWRPRFRYYHWTLAVLGIILNLALSVIAGWYYALAAFAIAAFIYKYIEYKGGVKAWGDGISGLTMTAAQRALLQLDEDPHTKNWRPQLLVLCKLDPQLKLPQHPRLLSLAQQLKAGKGLTVVATVLEGGYLDNIDNVLLSQQTLKSALEEERVKGFAKAMANINMTDGLSMFVQTVGLGGLEHNTVMIGWPNGWHGSTDNASWKMFIETVKTVYKRGLALLLPRGIDNFPDRKSRLSGTIDVWWVVNEGGMLILLAFLLKQHKVWRACKIRIFTVAQLTDNSIQIKKDLEMFLYQLRIEAEVHVEEMYDGDISAYTVERTMDMESRMKVMKELHTAKRRTSVQTLKDLKHANFHHKRFSGRSSSLKHNTQTRGRTAAVSDQSNPPAQRSMSQDHGETVDGSVHFTFTPGALAAKSRKPEPFVEEDKENIWEGKLMRMHTAVQLNQAICSRSSQAQIVIVNFPAPPSNLAAEENYMMYLEVLSEGLERVLMVHGSGKEVITMYS